MSSLRKETNTTLYLLRCYLIYAFGWGIAFGMILGLMYASTFGGFVYVIFVSFMTGFLITGPIMVFLSIPKIKRYDYQSLSKNAILKQIQSKNFTVVTSHKTHYLLNYQGFSLFKPKVVLDFSNKFFMVYAPPGLFGTFEKSFHWIKAQKSQLE